MSALATSIVVFAVIMGGALLGGYLRAVLPKHHLSEESKDIVKLAISMLTTLAALVLGLLIASAKSSFDARADEVRQVAAKIVLLDRNLRQLGADAQPIRDVLHKAVVAKADTVWIDAEAASPATANGVGQHAV